MTTAATTLSEPHVLAHTKQRLFPEETTDSYAVVDTQFSADYWLADQPIEPAIREALAPFNHVHVGGGYPDLVGVRTLESDLLAVERFGENPPLIAVEAKGYTTANSNATAAANTTATTTGSVDTQRGIVQAYDRLHEANVAYLAAPTAAISQTDRSLARELNVGILGVDTSGRVEPLEVPRLVGNRTTGEATAIRFQASAQGVTDRSFSLNHPKNYLGYPLAHAAAGPTDELLESYKIVRATEAARRGAAFLDLIDDGPAGVTLTPLGQEVVRFARRRYGSVESALEEFAGWYRSSKRFIDLAPAWGQLARQVVFAYPATGLVVSELQCLHADGERERSLVDLVEYLHVLHPSFTVELFIRSDETVRRQVLTPAGDLRREALESGHVYHSPTVFQLKAMWYHTGILTDRGAEPSRLDPLEDVWALREPVFV